MLHDEENSKNWLKKAIEMDKKNHTIILKEWKENELNKPLEEPKKEIFEDFNKCIKDYHDELLCNLIMGQYRPDRDADLLSLLFYFVLDSGALFFKITNIVNNIEF